MTTAILDELRTVAAEAEQHIRNWVTTRAPELERAATLAARVDADPLLQAAHAATGLSPGIRAALADLITRTDAEITSHAPSGAAAPEQLPVPDDHEAGTSAPDGPDPAPAPGGPVVGGTAS